MRSSGMALKGISDLVRSTITPARSPNDPGRLAAIITRRIFAERFKAGRMIDFLINILKKYDLQKKHF